MDSKLFHPKFIIVSAQYLSFFGSHFLSEPTFFIDYCIILKLFINLLKLWDVDLAESVDWPEIWSLMLINKATFLQCYIILWFDLALFLVLYQKAWQLGLWTIESLSKALSVFTDFCIFDWLLLMPITFLNKNLEFAAYFALNNYRIASFLGLVLMMFQ